MLEMSIAMYVGMYVFIDLLNETLFCYQNRKLVTKYVLGIRCEF